jgi:D-sedoheptulose 7-phosphate isomerase
MNQIKTLPKIDGQRFNELFNREFKNFTERYPALRETETDLKRASQLIANAYSNGKKVLTCGNGGSCADAEHIVGEFLKGFLKKRQLSPQDLEKLLPSLDPKERLEYQAQLQQPLRAISLMGHPSFQSAFANDKDAEFAIAQHLMALADPGDVLIAISTSGNAKNLVRATHVAKGLGVSTILLTGLSGGHLALVDCALRSPSNKVHEIQEHHLPLYHFLCYFVELLFFAD